MNLKPQMEIFWMMLRLFSDENPTLDNLQCSLGYIGCVRMCPNEKCLNYDRGDNGKEDHQL